MDIDFRKLTVRDLDMVMDMNTSFREGFVSRNNAGQFLNDPSNWLYAAVSGNKIVGFLYGYELVRLDARGNMLYVHEVGVMEKHQRRGIGLGLLSSLKEECRKRVIYKVFLFTERSNTAANGLYIKAGGQPSSDSGGSDICYFFRTN